MVMLTPHTPRWEVLEDDLAAEMGPLHALPPPPPAIYLLSQTSIGKRSVVCYGSTIRCVFNPPHRTLS